MSNATSLSVQIRRYFRISGVYQPSRDPTSITLRMRDRAQAEEVAEQWRSWTSKDGTESISNVTVEEVPSDMSKATSGAGERKQMDLFRLLVTYGGHRKECNAGQYIYEEAPDNKTPIPVGIAGCTCGWEDIERTLKAEGAA